MDSGTQKTLANGEIMSKIIAVSKKRGPYIRGTRFTVNEILDFLEYYSIREIEISLESWVSKDAIQACIDYKSSKEFERLGGFLSPSDPRPTVLTHYKGYRYIVRQPGVCGSRPTIIGHRLTVGNIVGALVLSDWRYEGVTEDFSYDVPKDAVAEAYQFWLSGAYTRYAQLDERVLFEDMLDNSNGITRPKPPLEIQATAEEEVEHTRRLEIGREFYSKIQRDRPGTSRFALSGIAYTGCLVDNRVLGLVQEYMLNRDEESLLDEISRWNQKTKP